jgi:hypothetical protein
MVFGKFTEMCNHHHNLIPEHFHHLHPILGLCSLHFLSPSHICMCAQGLSTGKAAHQESPAQKVAWAFSLHVVGISNFSIRKLTNLEICLVTWRWSPVFFPTSPRGSWVNKIWVRNWSKHKWVGKGQGWWGMNPTLMPCDWEPGEVSVLLCKKGFLHYPDEHLAVCWCHKQKVVGLQRLKRSSLTSKVLESRAGVPKGTVQKTT